MGRFVLPVSASLVLLVAAGAYAAAADSVEAALTFERDIRPIFKAHCFDCHGAESEPKGGLDLRLRRLMIAGGEAGPAIEPGDPEASYLVERIRAGEMPPGAGKVSPGELDTLVRWIQLGAPTARPEPDRIDPGVNITPEEREFWAFQPIRRPEVPETSDDDRIRTPIDSLLKKAMQPAGLTFSPDADRRTQILRLYFDLLGLPPTPAEIDAFVSDESPQAYERLVDRLLDSPHYGERWARHWLDVAGYADSEGYTNDDPLRPYAYKYRDYVIRSLNADKPFDQFIQEQLAGDELTGPKQGEWTAEQIELLTATGFLRMAADGTASGGVDRDVASNQMIADTIKIVSTSLLGLSLACAQCHDHRYDPLPQQDYYRLRAVFTPALDWQQWQPPSGRLVSLYTEADRATAAQIESEAQKIASERAEKQAAFIAAALEQELAKFEPPLRDQLRGAFQTSADKRTAEQQALLKQHPSVNITPGVLYQYNPTAAETLKKLDAQIAEVRSRKPAEDYLRALVEPPGHAPPTFVFHRGDYRQPTEQVAPGGLTITAPPGQRCEIPADSSELPTTGRRLAYARWLTSGRHPLVVRVFVNRVWMHYFGRGLVGTAGDFGRLGDQPTHPELLDWLADEFMACGWRVKQLHRSIVTSTVYRQSSARDTQKEAIDAENRYYWRMPVRRLDAESLRDRALAVSGSLVPEKMFGPPVAIKVDDAGQTLAEDNSRRSMYIQVRRSQPEMLLTAFDAPVMETNCERRSSSTVATQSLMLMNGTFLLQQAEQFAGRVRRESGDEQPPDEWQTITDVQPPDGPRLSQQVVRAWRLAYGRRPDEAELQVASRFLAAQLRELSTAGAENPAARAMTNFCQVLLSSNEFLYVD